MAIKNNVSSLREKDQKILDSCVSGNSVSSNVHINFMVNCLTHVGYCVFVLIFLVLFVNISYAVGLVDFSDLLRFLSSLSDLELAKLFTELMLYFMLSCCVFLFHYMFKWIK